MLSRSASLGIHGNRAFKHTAVTLAIKRSFHASNPNRWVEPAIHVAHDMLQGVHSVTGLPWVYSIPLTAITVRMLLAPLQVFSIRNLQNMTKVAPLIKAWSNTISAEIYKTSIMKRHDMNPSAGDKIFRLQIARKVRDLSRRWNFLIYGSFAHWLQLPIWLAMIDALRRMVGMSGGLFSVIQSWTQKAPDAALLPMEESLALEGALWFPDLLAADPTHALPIMLATVMYTNVTYSWKLRSKAEVSQMVGFELVKALSMRILKRTLQGFSILIAPGMILSEAPAALVLYWIFSTSFAIIQGEALRKFMAVRPIPKPCKPLSTGSIQGQTP